MEGLKMILAIVFVIVCIALIVVVLLQEGKSAGLGAISGAAETYWGKNKGRSMEGKLEKGTKFLVIGFFCIAIFLNIPFTSFKAAEDTNTNPTVTSTPSVSADDTQTDNDVADEIPTEDAAQE